MRKNFAALYSLFLLWPSGCDSRSSGTGERKVPGHETFFCIANVLHIRKGPGLRFAVAGRLVFGNKVIMLEKSRETFSLKQTGPLANRHWFRIRTEDGSKGWVFSAYLMKRLFQKPTRVKKFPKFCNIGILGWSSENRIAFIKKSNNSYACGTGFPTRFIVIDATKNKILYMHRDGCPINYWKQYRTLIHLMLKKFSIIPCRTRILPAGKSLSITSARWGNLLKPGLRHYKIMHQTGSASRILFRKFFGNMKPVTGVVLAGHLSNPLTGRHFLAIACKDILDEGKLDFIPFPR